MPRFVILLISMLLFLLVYPAGIELGLRGGILSIIMSALLFAVLASIVSEKRELYIGLVILGCEEFFRWSVLYGLDAEFSIATELLAMVFYAYVLYFIARQVLRVNRITVDEICGALCIFILGALMWAHSFAALELIDPGSFSGLDASAIGAIRFLDFAYFSLVTITTLGYGDISPISPTAKSFSATEAVVGQLFLAVLVARLVANYRHEDVKSEK